MKKALRLSNKKYARAYQQKKRREALEVLGGVCANCGFSNSIALSIDHKNPVHGNASTRAKKGETGATLYNKIINFPEERGKYQVLCKNCNWIKMIAKGERNTSSFDFVYAWEFFTLKRGVQELKRNLQNLDQRFRKSLSSREPKYSREELAKQSFGFREAFTNDKGKINVRRLRVLLREKENIHVSIGMGYDIKEWLIKKYPGEFIE